MINKSLSDVSKIDISGIDKVTKENEKNVRLCNFTDVYYNWAITKEKIERLMNASANESEIEKFTLRKNNVVITKDSETRDDIGISCFIADDLPNTILGYHCALIVPNADILDGSYLNAFLNTKTARKYFSNQASGSGQRYTLTVSGIGNVKIPLMELSKQKKIGQLFSYIDRKIQNNNMVNDNLLQLIDLHFEDLLFSDRVDNKRFTIQNMYDNILFTIKKPGVNEFNHKIYLATSEIDGLSIKDGWKINYKTRESRANMQPTINSIRFAKMKNSVKHLFLNQYMNYYINNTILSTGFYGLQCSEHSFEYVASLINNKNFENIKDILSHGATQQGIGDDDLKNIKIKIPEGILLDKYRELTKPLFDVLLKNINENRELVSLRDFLLPLLMNGQATIE